MTAFGNALRFVRIGVLELVADILGREDKGGLSDAQWREILLGQA